MQDVNAKIRKETIISTMSYMAIPGLKLDGYKFITTIVCNEFNVDKDEVFNRSRKRKYVFARQLMMYLAVSTMHSQTLSQIGAAYGGYDHATVLHAKKMMQEVVVWDKKLHERIVRLLDNVISVKKSFIQKVT